MSDNIKTDTPLKTLRRNSLSNVMAGKHFTHTFRVDFSEIDESFVGTFTVHIPTQLEKLQIGRTKSLLLGGMEAVDVMTDNIAHILATLDVILDASPDWFDIDDPTIDYTLCETIYTEYIEWYSTFRNRNKPSNNEGNSTATKPEVPMVGTENVQSPTNG